MNAFDTPGRAPALAVGFLVVCLCAAGNDAAASDACETRAIRTVATVSAGDGPSYRAESYFRAADAAAVRFVDERVSTIAVEGPFAWVGTDDDGRLAGDEQKTFALGHQYHALLLLFEEIMLEVEPVGDILLDDRPYRGRRGAFPDGGVAYLADEGEEGRPAGMRFELPGGTAIEVGFDDWRQTAGIELPFLLRIDDGAQLFQYAYETVDTAERSPLWFMDTVGVNGIDKIEVYRLHRRLMAAHCLAEADLIADLSAPETLVATRGELVTPTREETRKRFRALFESVDYERYLDLKDPVIETAAGGDMGWIAVNVNTVGRERSSGKQFDTQWAWVMLVKKMDGRWVHAGNASNLRRD